MFGRKLTGATFASLSAGFGLVLGLAAAPAAVAAQAKAPATTPAKAPAKAPAKKAPAPTRLYFVLAPDGNEARYRVREQLAGLDLPNDAIGATKEIAGRIVVESDGRIVRDSSRVVVQVGSLKSDKDRRDNFIRRRTMVTDSFPTVTLVPTAIKGLAGRPASGSRTFELVGDLTIRTVTRPTTWSVTAKFDGDVITGTATTAFTFADFGLVQPKVPVVLSVSDTIKLEYDFRIVPEPRP